MSLARRVVVAAIAGYRRWLSGRGPLARVRCTFHHGQSCSAFGLRAVDEAPGTWAALGRIRRRLRRCGATSIHALTDPAGRRALGWGPDHDRPLGELCAELTADGEQPADVAAVLAAREVVARWRGDATEVVALARLRRGLPRAQVLVRPPPSPRGTAVALAGRAALAGLAIAGAAALAPTIVAVAVAAVATLGLTATARARIARHARLAAQARAALLRDEPAASGAAAPGAISAAAPR
ncbi:MAG: membrane protein insertion efficiency factor YidD [Myxococcales bacterium]|nr:membrane protein insertion efficiency factor YidD [Myxococcales bacterium]